MKILNLYAGIGGNRKLWGNEHDITSVEYNKEIADIYRDFFPNDNIIVTDAHAYLLEHYKEYDFIWSSPPCPTHSRLGLIHVNTGVSKLNYPNMSLYQEIIILQNHFKGKFVVENVIPYYEPLIKSSIKLDRHLFWVNFYTDKCYFKKETGIKEVKRVNSRFGFKIENWHGYNSGDKRTILKNLVNPEIGLHFLNRVLEIKTQSDINEPKLF